MGLQGLKTFTITLSTEPKRIRETTGHLIATSLIVQVLEGESATYFIGDESMSSTNKQGIRIEGELGLSVGFDGQEDWLDVGNMFIMGTDGATVILSALVSKA